LNTSADTQLHQNHHEFDAYVSRASRGELPVYRIATPSKSASFAHSSCSCKLGHVSRDYFTKTFGTEPSIRFRDGLQLLKDWVFLVRGWRHDSTESRKGCCNLDRLVAAGVLFFLPEHKKRKVCLIKVPLRPAYRLTTWLGTGPIPSMIFTAARGRHCRPPLL